MRGQGQVKRKGQGKINVRLKQSNHNHNRNYNLMGFDIIEINLVQFSKLFENNLKQFKFWTRGCICDIEDKILQRKLFLTHLR